MATFTTHVTLISLSRNSLNFSSSLSSSSSSFSSLVYVFTVGKSERFFSLSSLLGAKDLSIFLVSSSSWFYFSLLLSLSVGDARSSLILFCFSCSLILLFLSGCVCILGASTEKRRKKRVEKKRKESLSYLSHAQVCEWLCLFTKYFKDIFGVSL